MKMREDYVAKLTADTEKHLENLYQASESLRKGREGGGCFRGGRSGDRRPRSVTKGSLLKRGAEQKGDGIGTYGLTSMVRSLGCKLYAKQYTYIQYIKTL